MAISQSYIDSLTRQVFVRDYILNGLFPCQSDIVRSIRSKKRNWEFNDRFEYRMLLSTGNNGGTLNSQIFNPNVSLRKPNNLTTGTFKATYGAISSGYDVDMTINLETENSRAAFMNDYALQVHGMRVDVASLFKNFAVSGKMGVVHRISQETITGMTGDRVTITGTAPTVQATVVPGSPFTIRVPMNVFASGFKTGRYLIKTTGTGLPAGVSATFGSENWRPEGAANVAEVYMVLDNQPRRLTLVSVGTTETPWLPGEFLELFGNRNFMASVTQFWGPPPASWDVLTMPMWSTAVNAVNISQWLGTGWYTCGVDTGVGAMEGIADLFPWHLGDNGVDYLSPNAPRQGMDLPFRNHPNRLMFSAEMGGQMYVRQANESIIDAIMQGVALTTASVPHADLGVWMNPDTMLAMAEQETQNVNWVKQIVSSAPLVFQRGITSHDYQIGSRTIPATLQDYNLPTNIVIIGPRDNLSYNCWAQDMYKIDEFVQETFSSTEPKEPEELSVPKEFVTKLDFSSRITYGSPVLGDHARTTEFLGGNFIHPSNRLPIAFHEMGALFTEHPHAYTVVNLRREVIQPNDVNNWED